jgi:cysteine desulfurase family protein (TIGR01976 family)
MAIAAINSALQQRLRSQFPALRGGFIYLENAGGSQMAGPAIRAMSRFFEDSFVQTGAGYPAADRADRVVQLARQTAQVLMNGDGAGWTAFGSSTTQLLHALSDGLAHLIRSGDEVVVSAANHEANIAPWIRLEAHGAKVLWWLPNPASGESDLAGLSRLLGPRTRLVALTHASNLLGHCEPVKAAAALAHDAGALVVVDGVAHASHQAVDVQAIDADFYAFSFYKVYGPHMAALFGTREAWSEVRGRNHFFFDSQDWPRKFELGCLPYESLAAVVGLGEYLKLAAGRPMPEEMPHPADCEPVDRAAVEAAFGEFQRLELGFMRPFLDWLRARTDVRILGRSHPGPDRHATVSFTHQHIPSDEAARRVNECGIGVRSGHMYSMRLCEAMNVDPEPGVIRVSAVHTSAPEEAVRVCEALERAFV